MALGELIVHELELTDGCDTLGKWMAHHLVQLIEQAKRTDGTQNEADQEAANLILKLWDRRNSLPDTADPLSKLRRVIDIINLLDPNSSPFYPQSRDKREADLALLFDGLRQLVVQGVLLISDQKEIPPYTESTFAFLSEEEQQIIVALNGWLEENKPKTLILDFVDIDKDAKEKKAEEAVKQERLTPEERSRVQLSQSVDELIERLQNFKKNILDHG